jgi:hypothetical protein
MSSPFLRNSSLPINGVHAPVGRLPSKEEIDCAGSTNGSYSERFLDVEMATSPLRMTRSASCGIVLGDKGMEATTGHFELQHQYSLLLCFLFRALT